MLTVFAIADEPVIEAGLRALLSESEDFCWVGSAGQSAELRKPAWSSPPDVIVDAEEGEQDLFVTLTDVRRAAPRAAIILLRRTFSVEYAHRALDLGVRGLLSRTSSAEMLKDCVKKAGLRELWVESALSVMLLDNRPIHLSKRQAELIALVAQGLRNKEIAGILGISEGTVKAYMTTLFDKVGARDRFELALFGLRHFRDFDTEGAIKRPVRSFVPQQLSKPTVA
jgi:DNA-binding NarL/FixJ family response regulator